MTLDEAIEHCKEVMENKNKTLLKYFDRLTYDSIENCNKCIDEHMQLMKWLEELKELRKQKDKFDENIKFFNDINLKCHNQGYNKAIDDFVKEISIYGTYDYYENAIDVSEIANQLKKGELNETNNI